jgi:DNA-binding MarR family transcriptional regulator
MIRYGRRITQLDRPDPFAVDGEDPLGFAPVGEDQQRKATTGIGAARSLLSAEGRLAHTIIARRQERAEVFGDNMFGEPAWDMLLFLFVTHEEQKKISVSGLCTIAGVPSSTGLRWIKHLFERGLISRTPDQSDGRRVWIDLAPEVVRDIRLLLARWLSKSGKPELRRPESDCLQA